jgi:hypothetical protein
MTTSVEGDNAEFVIRAANKTIKQEDALTRQILYACWSAYSKDPINLGIVAPTSEGKTYPVIECLKFVPNEDVWKIGQMSTKVLVRQKGLLVDKDGQDLKPQLKELEKTIMKLEGKKENVETLLNLKEQRRELLEDAKMLIDLTGKTLVFLEPPQHELWNLLKPILSHDTEEIAFPYVDRTDRTGLVAKKVVVKGWPACIFCSARDESNWPVWQEIVSRFLITSPNMNKVKYAESNMLIAQRKSLPGIVQQRLIISDEEVELAKGCFDYVKQNIQEMSKPGISGKSGPVWIPYGLILGEVLPADKGTDTRATKRLFSFLNIIPLTKAQLRPKLAYNSDRMVIATLDDLQEVLHINQNLNGIPAYKVKFFQDIFCKLYESKSSVDEKDGKHEERIAVTTRQLVEYYKEQTGKVITSNNLKTTYLNELQNAGFIDSLESNLDKRQEVYWPIIKLPSEELQKSTDSVAMDNFLRFARLNIPINCKGIPEDWLTYEILSLKNYPVNLNKFALLDPAGKEKTITEFVADYEKRAKLTGYFVKHYPSNSYKYFGQMKPKSLIVTEEKAEKIPSVPKNGQLAQFMEALN